MVNLSNWPFRNEKQTSQLGNGSMTAGGRAACGIFTFAKSEVCHKPHDSACRSELPCHAPVASALALITDNLSQRSQNIGPIGLALVT